MSATIDKAAGDHVVLFSEGRFRVAPAGITVCLVGNDERQDVRMLWCPTEADYVEFLCGPGANFARTCAEILGADPLKRGTWK